MKKIDRDKLGRHVLRRAEEELSQGRFCGKEKKQMKKKGILSVLILISLFLVSCSFNSNPPPATSYSVIGETGDPSYMDGLCFGVELGIPPEGGGILLYKYRIEGIINASGITDYSLNDKSVKKPGYMQELKKYGISEKQYQSEILKAPSESYYWDDVILFVCEVNDNLTNSSNNQPVKYAGNSVFIICRTATGDCDIVAVAYNNVSVYVPDHSNMSFCRVGDIFYHERGALDLSNGSFVAYGKDFVFPYTSYSDYVNWRSAYKCLLEDDRIRALGGETDWLRGESVLFDGKVYGVGYNNVGSGEEVWTFVLDAADGTLLWAKGYAIDNYRVISVTGMFRDEQGIKYGAPALK